MSTFELINNGFQKANKIAINEYKKGIVTVKLEADEMATVFITNIKINGIRNMDELMYMCKRVNEMPK